VLVLATTYAREEMALDLLPYNPPMDDRGYDDRLTFRPYQPGSNDDYRAGQLDAGALQRWLIAPLPDPATDDAREDQLKDLPGAGKLSVVVGTGLADGARIALTQWEERALARWHELEARSGGDDETEADVSGETATDQSEQHPPLGGNHASS
jgi:hypothetical protein